MVVFEYRAVNNNGEVISGLKESNSKNELFAQLRKDNLKPISAEITNKKINNIDFNKKRETNSSSENSSSFDFNALANMEVFPQKITTKDYSIFCRQAYTMLNAGMNIISTLQILTIQIENKRLGATIGKVVIELQKGYPLSTCLRMFPKVFPTLFINMIESGELTGNLDGVLLSLSKYYEREAIIGTRIKKASAYPKVIGIVAIVVVALLLIFVVPEFEKVFDDAGAELPAITLLLMDMSAFVQAYWYVIALIIIGFAFAIKAIKRNENTKYYYDKFIYRIPLIGKSVVKITTARFSRTAATLLNSGIPIIQAINAAAQVSENALVIKGVEDVSDEIRSGHNLSTMLQTLNYFPPMLISMISIGEESGDMVNLLDKSADFYEEEMSEAIDTLVGLLEPMLILFLALVVGFIVLAIFTAVLGLATTVQ